MQTHNPLVELGYRHSMSVPPGMMARVVESVLFSSNPGGWDIAVCGYVVYFNDPVFEQVINSCLGAANAKPAPKTLGPMPVSHCTHDDCIKLVERLCKARGLGRWQTEHKVDQARRDLRDMEPVEVERFYHDTLRELGEDDI